ncbi:MAG: response regulator [Clostridia bacterium]|nr:response regulator [Clostridia bacterium]
MTKLNEIFMNIISNAIKYTPAGGKIDVRVEELPCDEEGFALYRSSVRDNGIGMSKEFLPYIFDSFTRERNTTMGKVAGTGLGLAIVKKLTDAMGGTVEVDSAPDKGTTFTVTFKHRIATEEMPTIAESPAKDISSFKGKRILLAEDNELNAEIAMTVLEDTGFMVEHAEDGDVCVEKLKNSEPGYYDLILMDIQMPRMDGYTATKQIRALSDSEKADIPIIAMTANAFEEDKKNAFDAGMTGFVAKPIDITALMETLSSVLHTSNK